MPIQRIRLPEILPEPISHYTDAVKFGDMLWLAGIVGENEDGTMVKGGVYEQAVKLFDNMGKVLRACGAEFENVVKVTVYLTKAEDRETVNIVRKKVFGENRPASTLIVTQLAKPEFLLEVEAVAYLGK